MNTSKLRIRKGENVRDAWERLVWWVDSLKIVDHPDVSFRYTPHGVIVRPNKLDRWAHPWRVGASAELAAIGDGMVNGIVPNINGREGLVRMDNRDKAGVLQRDRSRPNLELSKSKVGDDGATYISLRVKPSISAQGFEVQTDPISGKSSSEDVEIVQMDSATGARDGYVYYPLAMIYFSEDKKSVEDIFQIVHHNLRFTFQERNATEVELSEDPERTRIGQGIFYPA